MRGFPKHPLSGGLGAAGLVSLLLLPSPAGAQSKTSPRPVPPSSAGQSGTTQGPLLPESGHVRLGDDAPNFKLLDTAGRPTSFHEWRGHRGAVLMFADRTQDFPDGFPVMVENLRKIDVRTVGVCRSSGAIPASVSETGSSAVILRDRWGDLAGQYGVTDVLSGDAVPAVVILDPRGRVRYVSAGAIPDLAIVEGIVNGVLERAKQETY